MKRLQNIIPLKPETHPDNYTGYKFLSLIMTFNNDSYICIIDNVINGEVVAYVLDLFPKVYDQNVSELEVSIIKQAEYWFNNKKHLHPFSVELSIQGQSNTFSKILKRFPIENITRAIGPLPSYNMGAPIRIKKRKKKKLSPGIKIVNNTNFVLPDCHF